MIFQSTAPVWGPTDRGDEWQLIVDISIHGPRVGADAASKLQSLKLLPISIHGPRVGADFDAVQRAAISKKFQSTAPVWGPT